MAKKYEESQAVKDAAAKLAGIKAPDAWNGGNYGTAINDALAKIQNRPAFNYDPSNDALYNSYKNSYMTAGKQAMKDTVGQATALTGGYANSYAQNAGQQAYQQYLGALNDRMPELYQLALDKYDRDTASMVQNYNLMSDAYNREYGQYNDAYNRFTNERGYLTDALNNARTMDYNRYADELAQENWQRNYDYQAAQDALAQQNYLAEMEYQKQRDAVADSQWQAEFDLARQKAASSGGSKNTTTTTTPSGSTKSEISGNMNKIGKSEYEGLMSAARNVGKDYLFSEINRLVNKYNLTADEGKALFDEYKIYLNDGSEDKYRYGSNYRATGYYV